ncbi:HAD-IIA family hydrolase [Williamsia soli]|uniref:HAD-IIA family hydrolase n=1 Tax=Williamsia soli TaxID=364929 RepID=UPI001A9D40AB|nr:HAD-IIA family hydrolase [Williamsia soli]
MNDRNNRGGNGRGNSGGGRPTDRRDGPSGRNFRNDSDARRGTGSANRPPEPPLPDDVVPQDLDTEVRRDLLSLDRTNADTVSRHLIMTFRLLDEDPVLALEHARAARRRAGRIAMVREAAGIAAYTAQEWAEALSELRAARRMSGGNALLPMIADCERGLGRPERAIDVARSDEGRALTGEDAAEMRIVESGARLDLGEFDKAIVTLQTKDLDPARVGTDAARYFYAYAAALLAAGRRDDAITWFMNAASADDDDVTDAEDRLMELAEPDPAAEGPDAEPALLAPVHAEAPKAVSEVSAPTALKEVPEQVVPQLVPAAPAEPGARLRDGYDVLLLDLDGTVYAGKNEIPGAKDALDAGEQRNYYVTNNASRSPVDVAEHLQELGFRAEPDQVVTSAQSAARLLAEQLPMGSRVLVVGTDALVHEVRSAGLGVTRSADDRPAAVVQGHSPDTGWAILSEAVLAIRAGALWVACNVDATLPTDRGLQLGNGSMVAAVANATGAQPQVAGKPASPLMVDAVNRSGSKTPLVVGDRLDTDIEGANAIEADSLLVLTGVSTAADALNAPEAQRPTFIASDLQGLNAAADDVIVGPRPGWHVSVLDHTLTVVAQDGADPAAVLYAVLHEAWSRETSTKWIVEAAEEVAQSALMSAGLLA